MTVLVIAAHPDDEVLGCGGTISIFSKKGNKVYTLILGEGITSRDEKRNRAGREREIEQLKSQVSEANKMMGVIKDFVFDFPDNRFDTVALLDVVKTVEKVKLEVHPDIVLTHHRGDLNIDHQITYRAVITAFRPLKGETVREIYSFEVPSSTEWSREVFLPQCYFSIDEKCLKSKINALRCYEGELRSYPHPRSPEAIEILAKWRGLQVGVELAEAFEVVRIIN